MLLGTKGKPPAIVVTTGSPWKLASPRQIVQDQTTDHGGKDHQNKRIQIVVTHELSHSEFVGLCVQQRSAAGHPALDLPPFP